MKGWTFNAVGTPQEVENRLDETQFGSDKSAQAAKTYVIDNIREATLPYVSVVMTGQLDPTSTHGYINFVGFATEAEAQRSHQRIVDEMERRERDRTGEPTL